MEHCTNLSSEGLDISEYITEDTQKTVWIIHIPKHLPRRPVYAHKKVWQRVEFVSGNDFGKTICHS